MRTETWGLFGGSSTTLDPFPGWQTETWTCNCACGICMAGDCCQRPGRPSVPTYTSNGTAPLLAVHEHDYKRFDRRRLYCRTCGETKAMR